MLAAIIKALPFLWPFLKEYITRSSDPNPGPANRNKTPWRLIVLVLLFVVIMFVRHITELSDKNAELEKRILELANTKPPVVSTPPETITKDHVELRLCQQQYQTLMSDYRISEADKDRAIADLAKVSAELASCKAPQPPKIKSVPKNDAADRLEKLESKEGNN